MKFFESSNARENFCRILSRRYRLGLTSEEKVMGKRGRPPKVKQAEDYTWNANDTGERAEEVT